MSFINRVYITIYELPMGAEFVIEDRVPENKVKDFIQEIKSYIQYEYGFTYGFDLELSQDQTRFRKIDVKELLK